MKKKVLIVQPIHESGMKVFDDRFEVKVAPDPSVETVKREIKGVEGVVVRTAPFTREIIAAADSLKVIARHGVGVDNIDVRAATERGILVVNTPDANAVSVAEHTITAIGALAKRLLSMDLATRRGEWEVRNEYKAVDLDGKVLGLVGLGRIGTMVAKKAAAAFNMRVIAYDPYVRPETAAENNITLYSDLDRIFQEADVVSLHTPLTPETRGLVNEERLALMKASAFLINFSRGGVVDEDALYKALKNGLIAGAALDVFEEEPPPHNHPLFELDNVLLSPHSAALTKECVVRMATGAAQGVVDVLTGKRPQYVVNPEVLQEK
ncbi:hydroxyacid dehydrogenase [Neomoorella humiferrea]|uniref:D-3-phosphoglycerate dehydrogenase n=1 Tax=Neomoorella humiferrea TaxID=676965 RepID=A0A2T0AW96_9FIRM|nr:hydroxyacid dehydrogenase [Moorella humiferrea]PRR75014.1 D-3-phosphoglycerate dehydrogenase [Moorella humiferrea]